MGKRDRWESSSEEDNNSTGKGKNKKNKNKNKQATTSFASAYNKNETTEEGVSSSVIVPNSNVVATSAAAASIPPPLSLPRHNPLTQGCRSVYDTYDRIHRVSEGTYGVVWKARDLATDEIVALKQIKFDVNDNKEGFPLTALREINVLLHLSHESIVSVREMVVGDAIDRVYMVMEFFEFDLKDGISRFNEALAQSELKGIMKQILSAIDHMHSKWYLHRDLKTSNILVHRSGRIALADFGLARRYQDPPRALTQLVVTLWYRSPELLLGESRYGPPVDMWSIGCIFGELICKDAIMQGQGELDQIDKIFELVGVPDDLSWPTFGLLPNAAMFRWKPRKKEELLLPQRFRVATPLSSKQAYLDAKGYDLLSCLLTLDPSRRISAKDALNHRYFKEGVPPSVPHFFSSS